MDALKKISIFKTLSPAGIEQIARGTVFVSHRKKSIIFKEGEKSAFIYAIHSGLARTYKHACSGEDVLSNIRGPGDMLNVDVVAGERFFMSAEALTDVALLRIERQRYCSVLFAFPEIALAVGAVLAKQIDELTRAAVILSEETNNKTGQVGFANNRKGP